MGDNCCLQGNEWYFKQAYVGYFFIKRINKRELIKQAGMDIAIDHIHPKPVSNPHQVTATHTVHPSIPAVAPIANWAAAWAF